jgi:hypothetical protein
MQGVGNSVFYYEDVLKYNFSLLYYLKIQIFQRNDSMFEELTIFYYEDGLIFFTI